MGAVGNVEASPGAPIDQKPDQPCSHGQPPGEPEHVGAASTMNAPLIPVGALTGRRLAGLKSCPVKYATARRATCVTVSGMPKMLDASDSKNRWSVVHAEPMARARSANMRDQTAGRMEPYSDA